MIHRREFQDKLTKELLKIVHLNSLTFVFERRQGCMYMDSQINWIPIVLPVTWEKHKLFFQVLWQTTQRSPVRINHRTGRKAVACEQTLHFEQWREVTEEQRFTLARFLAACFSRNNWTISSLQARRAPETERYLIKFHLKKLFQLVEF